MIRIPFDTTYTQLPSTFYADATPRLAPAPALVHVNRPLLAELGIAVDAEDDEQLAAMFSGNQLPDGATPIALAYAGHQFGQFVPQLGDGRAVLLGEVVDVHGRRRDIQLKGSGRTPFSRGGDGKAPIGPVLREYLVSEAMHALGVPTTRALAAVTTGDWVFRELREPGAVLTRVAASHARIGTVQYFAARGDADALRRLTDYVLNRHYPDRESTDNAGMSLLAAVAEQQAKLVAQWMCLGFVHGVMNTDNMTLSGETIDYGPCAFMEQYNPKTSFSSIDVGGRYAYGNQPMIAQWNLARLAEALLAAEDEPDELLEQAKATLALFFERYEHYWLAGMAAKLGLQSAQPGDTDLINQWLDLMAANETDFTQAFRALAGSQSVKSGELQALFTDQPALDAWLVKWRLRLQEDARPEATRTEAMNNTNPAVIPRNHRVQEALSAAEEGDYAPFEALLSVLQKPYESTVENARYHTPAEPAERVFRTFCGT